MESTATLSCKMAVAIALDELVNEIEFKDMRVNDICVACGLSRSAFYRLFEDKHEVPIWCQRFALDAGIREIGRTLDVVEGNTVSLDGLLLFRNLMASAGRSREPRSVRSTSVSLHMGYMTETLRDYRHMTIDDELAFQIDNAAMSQSETVARWLGGAFDLSSRALAERIASCMPPRLFGLMNDPVTPGKPRELTLASMIMAKRA